MVGAVIGDCLGARFEAQSWGKTIDIKKAQMHRDYTLEENSLVLVSPRVHR